MSPPIVLLSDFGTTDGYAAAMRGAILSYDPTLTVHDASHNIRSFSIPSAAYVLHTVLAAFPAGTIFVCVVDPGVGGVRRELIAEIDGRIVVAPDNGLITLASSMAQSVHFYRASDQVLAELLAIHPPHSRTFDGRDLFAPLSARISANGLQAVTGELLRAGEGSANGGMPETPPSVVLMDSLKPVTTDPAAGQGRSESTDVAPIEGAIMHLDSFGNAITTIRLPADADQPPAGGGVLCAGKHFPMQSAFSDVQTGVPLSYWGSYGFLELAVSQGSAQASFGLDPGMTVSYRALLDIPG
jgi:S-adenosyl-L-methionine hydrolase (adenosine-forming)